MKQEEKIRLAKKNEHISTEEILQDIANTEAEIAQIIRESRGHNPMENRMEDIKATAIINRTLEMENFIENLKTILEIRGV